MKKSRSRTTSRLFTARAPLAAVGLKLRSLKLFDIISQHVHIKRNLFAKWRDVNNRLRYAGLRSKILFRR